MLLPHVLNEYHFASGSVTPTCNMGSMFSNWAWGRHPWRCVAMQRRLISARWFHWLAVVFLSHRERQEQLMGYRKRGPKPKHLLVQVRKDKKGYLILVLVISRAARCGKKDHIVFCQLFFTEYDSNMIHKKWEWSSHFPFTLKKSLCDMCSTRFVGLCISAAPHSFNDVLFAKHLTFHKTKKSFCDWPCYSF